MNYRTWLVVLFSFVVSSHAVIGEDWTQFRGPETSGVSADKNLPVTWSETENLKWKLELPGAGSSSPIVLGERVFVTCYSGYGVGEVSNGEIESLERHLVCVNRQDGKVLWSKVVASETREDQYEGYLKEHGYASGTPVTDGERVYVFYGKSGVIAYDLQGEEQWRTSVGTDSSNRQWGSGASLILHQNLVVVNASEESKTIRALDRSTGKEVWKSTYDGLSLSYGTPKVVTLQDGTQELVVAMPYEAWGMDPFTKKLHWYVVHKLTGNICPSIISDGDTVFVFGGYQSSGSFAVKAGQRKDGKEVEAMWTSRSSSYVATPVFYEGHLYWISDKGQAFCTDAKTGEEVYRERVAEIGSGGRPVYASPVIANGKIYVQTRWDGVLVLPAKPEFKVLAQNRLDDESDFNATPAISNNELVLRSNRHLYCIGKTAQ